MEEFEDQLQFHQVLYLGKYQLFVIQLTYP